MVTLETLKDYANVVDDSQDESLANALTLAQGQVDAFVGLAPVPVAIRDWAVLETANAFFKRRSDSNGIRGYNGDGTPIFFARDPMQSVYPVLRRYVMPF